MRVKKTYRFIASFVAMELPFIIASPVFADASTPGVSNTINFFKTLVNILCAIAGPLCAVYLAVNGVGYITSSGNPERLENSKRGIVHSLVGLVIVIAALVIANGATSIANSAFGSS
ncbi:MAG TPA: pilin [Candidatus Saccharimonadales bacterium]|nr:pilin [Candidatus Saccharimonadales bacterium]